MKRRFCISQTFVKQKNRLTGSEWAVLVILGLHHNIERGCWPSKKTITELTGLDRTTVTRALKSLQVKRLLSVETEGNKRIYRLPVDEHNNLIGILTQDAESHDESAETHSNDVVSHKNVAELHNQKCRDASSYNTHARASEVTIEHRYNKDIEVTHQPLADAFVISSTEEGKRTLPLPATQSPDLKDSAESRLEEEREIARRREAARRLAEEDNGSKK